MIGLTHRMPRLARLRTYALIAAAFAGATLWASLMLPAAAQEDRWVRDIIRMSDEKDPEDGFCRRTPWRVAGARAQDQFLDRAVVGTAEAAKFASGACSYTRVTEVTRGRYGKCLKYTWWACEPGNTCDKGQTSWCKKRDGSWEVEE